ncbi:TerB family tellurite resistance protein [Candidatus Pelagibacter sp.]|nr:TerB family tellurite resistance protein [Candidatus Pelagibacter sp.]
MIFKFFNKNKEKTDSNAESINIACLLIHAAKIDENYTLEEKEIVKKTVKQLYPDLDDLDEVVAQAELKENDSNHIQEFTRDVKSLSTENKIIIVETLWRIILSDGKSDIYENNLMRRLAGLLYLDDKVIGETKVKVLNKK